MKHHQTHDQGAHGEDDHASSHYGRLGIMTLLSFIAMYVLMYAMVDVTGNVFMNLNQVYMAGLMTAPMVLIELLLMGTMYRNGKLNAAIAAGAVLVGVLCFMFIRRQAAIGDRQFLRSMIPHHASAILMCNQASVQDAKIKDLCRNIVSGQQAEIEQMKAMLNQP